MAATLINLAGYQWGVGSDETGINVSQFDVTVRPEFKEFLQDRSNHKIGFAVGDPEEEISVAGEIKGALMISDFVTAVTLANTVDYLGMSAGTIFLDEAAISQGRGAWKNLSAKLSRNKNIVLAP